MTGIPWLTILIVGPILGSIAVALIPREEKALVRNVALGASLAIFGLSIPLLLQFQAGVGGFQLTYDKVENIAWIPSIGVSYHVGVDGISLFLVLLTTLLTPVAILSTYKAVDTKVKEYMIALLVLETGMIGALVALDVFLFYVFWEVMLIPMYLIIGVWGGPNRRYAAVKFFIYTMIGSVLMLVALLYVYFRTDAYDFSVVVMWEAARSLSAGEQTWLFLAFALAFAIKVPLFPFHTWLPDAHVQAPTAGSVILASVLLKMGIFGLIRYAMPMFPIALMTFAPYIAILSVIGIIYGALMAWIQKDVKSLVAYSSVSHLGFCVLGLMALTPEGITGALYVAIAHGISTGGLFLCVGFLYEQRHKRGIDDFGGLAKQLPNFSTFFVIIVLASVGLPGLCGFVGEYLVLFGTASSRTLHFGSDMFYFFTQPEACSDTAMGLSNVAPGCVGLEVTSFIFTAVASLGVILAAVYLLHMVQKVLFGKIVHEENKKLKDLGLREFGYLLPIIVLAFVLGLFPGYFIDRMEPSVDRMLDEIEAGYDVDLELLEQEALDETAALLPGEVDR